MKLLFIILLLLAIRGLFKSHISDNEKADIKEESRNKKLLNGITKHKNK